MDAIYSINIERAVLSSILFNPEEIDEAKKIINAKDFYLPAHQKIFEVMNILNDELMPIDEEFIKKRLGTNFDENILIEILSSNPITNVGAYLKEIKESSTKRRLMSLTTEIKKLLDDENNSSVKILSDLEDKIKYLSKTSVDNFLKAKPLSQIEEEETEYICKNLIPFPKYSVGIISAKGGVGKTFAALKEADAFIEEQFKETGAYKRVLILATEDRAGKIRYRANKLNLKHLQYIEISSIYSFDVLEKDFKTQNWKTTEDFYKFKADSEKYDLIIIDPMISFYSGKENDNGDAKKFMMPFVKVANDRNQNIIFLHHADKEGKGSRGAGAFADATRLTYFVSKETFKNSEGKIEEVKNSTKLRFEVQKQNDDISSIKELENITTVSSIGSFLVDIFPIKVEIREFKQETKKETPKKSIPNTQSALNLDESDTKDETYDFEAIIQSIDMVDASK
jgi:replicative DNA helicase